MVCSLYRRLIGPALGELPALAESISLPFRQIDRQSILTIPGSPMQRHGSAQLDGDRVTALVRGRGERGRQGGPGRYGWRGDRTGAGLEGETLAEEAPRQGHAERAIDVFVTPNEAHYLSSPAALEAVDPC